VQVGLPVVSASSVAIGSLSCREFRSSPFRCLHRITTNHTWTKKRNQNQILNRNKHRPELNLHEVRCPGAGGARNGGRIPGGIGGGAWPLLWRAHRLPPAHAAACGRCPVNKAVEVGDPTIGESGGHAMEWRDAPWRRRHREPKGWRGGTGWMGAAKNFSNNLHRANYYFTLSKKSKKTR
jgi:hypothetical protein